MATNGAISYGDVVGNEISSDAYRLRWERSSFSVSNNTSTIQWTFEVRHQGSGTLLGSRDYTVTIDGTIYTGGLKGRYNAGWRTIQTGSTTLSHAADGTKTFAYSFTIKQGALTPSASGVSTLDTIPRAIKVTNIPKFNDEENPRITYSNPYLFSITSLHACISLTGEKDDVPYREISRTADSYTFELTDSERATLRKAVTKSNQISVRFYIKTIIGDVTFYSYSTGTLTLVNYAPVLTPSIIDTNNRTLELTGNRNKLIKYYSNASVTFGANGQKEATIVSRSVTNGSHTIYIEDRGQDTVTINGVDSNTFYLQAMDSRGIESRDAVVFSEDNGNFIPYVKLTNNLSTVPITANGVLTFTVHGKYYDGSFGATNNDLEVEYLVLDDGSNPVFNKNGSGWVQLGVVTPSVDGSDYTYSYSITGLDYRNSYKLTVNVIDKLTPAQSATKTFESVAVFDWDKDDFKHHTNVYLDNNKTLRSFQADGTDIQLMGVNTNNNLTIGWGGYENSNGDTGLYGNNVKLFTKGDLLINNRVYGANKVLWNGGSSGRYMNAEQEITLSEPVLSQPNGIVLVFSAYETATGYALNVSWNTHFVPKHMVNVNAAGGQSFLLMNNAGFGAMGAKYLYINNETIKGHSGNTLSGTNSGITFNNGEYVLRYVIGV